MLVFAPSYRVSLQANVPIFVALKLLENLRVVVLERVVDECLQKLRVIWRRTAAPCDVIRILRRRNAEG